MDEGRRARSHLSKHEVLLLCCAGAVLVCLSLWTTCSGAATVPHSGSDGDEIQAERRSPTKVEGKAAKVEPTPVLSAPESIAINALLSADAFDAEDARRLHCVNAFLKDAGLSEIDPRSKISPENILAFRAIVDESNRLVTVYLQAWRRASKEGLQPLRRQLFDDIASGKTDDLPLKSKSNPMKRRHPYESITQVQHEGKTYVLRVSPQDAPNLLLSGNALHEARRDRVVHFDSLIRLLFTL